MTKIIFLGNWGETPTQLLNRLSNQTPNKSGIWGDIVGVTNLNEADYYIVLEGYNGNLDTTRDWGHAKDYVKAMWEILPN